MKMNENKTKIMIVNRQEEKILKYKKKRFRENSRSERNRSEIKKRIERAKRDV